MLVDCWVYGRPLVKGVKLHQLSYPLAAHGPAALPAVRPDHGSTANVAVRRSRTNVESWYPTWQLESGPSPVHTPYTQYIDGYSM